MKNVTLTIEMTHGQPLFNARLNDYRFKQLLQLLQLNLHLEQWSDNVKWMDYSIECIIDNDDIPYQVFYSLRMLRKNMDQNPNFQC